MIAPPRKILFCPRRTDERDRDGLSLSILLRLYALRRRIFYSTYE